MIKITVTGFDTKFYDVELEDGTKTTLFVGQRLMRSSHGGTITAIQINEDELFGTSTIITISWDKKIEPNNDIETSYENPELFRSIQEISGKNYNKYIFVF